MAKKKSFENSLKRLEEIANEMEQSEVTLDNSLKLYKEGVEEAVFCSNFLKEIEQEVYTLKKDANDVFKLKSFYDMEE